MDLRDYGSFSMCGIVGYYSRNNEISPKSFSLMLNTLKTRGPDGRGTQFFNRNHVALGHTRLSIIDLSEQAGQPMPNEDKTVWLTFNGEIYNFKKLRSELEAAGHHFKTQSDSEVIVHGYEEWGFDVVLKLRGIFAIGIWDSRKEILFLARDHVGVKPLYYLANEKMFLFASQPRALLAHERVKAEVDLTSFEQYFSYRYVPADRSIYRGIKKLPPAHCLVISKKDMKKWQYWELKYDPVITEFQEAEDAIRSKIIQSVELQLTSDVPVGLFLSGGIDSTALGGISSDCFSTSLPAYTMGFDKEQYDERSFARIAAQRMRSPINEQLMTFDRFIEGFSLLAEIYDEPFHDYSGLFIYNMSMQAKSQGVSVILGGDGGDEVFAGYKWYEDPTGSMDSYCGREQLGRFFQTPRKKILNTLFNRVGFLTTSQQMKLFEFTMGEKHLNLFDRYLSGKLPTVTALQYLDFHTFLPDDILLKVDHASMMAGVETRVPYLDVELVETAFQVDQALMMNSQERKALLKSATKEFIPPELLTTRKKGFGAPLEHWESQGLRDQIKTDLANGYLIESGLVKKEDFLTFLDQQHINVNWLFMAFELWARKWLNI
ncbi:asparagine synthase (glutamine-hydrolyzing) [uncultured Rubinisphaera sp.]|uniref:asparagine synthase (glutamine-hydrolyzing) n=1 Tax=uncultured Rubinisphaera sp. TaxID=1678686 RepID=UPI0030D8CF72